jgi:hypothetical protein
MPAPLGEPLWVDDPGFRLERHLRIESRVVRGRRARLRRAFGRWRLALNAIEIEVVGDMHPFLHLGEGPGRA